MMQHCGIERTGCASGATSRGRDTRGAAALLPGVLLMLAVGVGCRRETTPIEPPAPASPALTAVAPEPSPQAAEPAAGLVEDATVASPQVMQLTFRIQDLSNRANQAEIAAREQDAVLAELYAEYHAVRKKYEARLAACPEVASLRAQSKVLSDRRQALIKVSRDDGQGDTL